MRLAIEQSAQFRRDLKAAIKRGYDVGKLNAVVELLASGATLPLKNRDHQLTGSLSGYRECHIAPNWLLVYRVEDDALVLYLFRTGTHSDLF
jgi:mRNA interferase YafQ